MVFSPIAHASGKCPISRIDLCLFPPINWVLYLEIYVEGKGLIFSVVSVDGEEDMANDNV